MNTYLSVYLSAASLSILATPLVIRLANRIGAVDRPGVRAVHRHPIPRIGGLAICVSAMCVIAAVLFLDNAVGAAFRSMHRQLTVLFCAVMLIFLLGLVDDLRGLPARFKFAVELIAAAALCLAGVRVDTMAVTDTLVLHLGGWGYLLTLLWVVGITNAVNLSDGLDGLAAGVSLIACGVIAIFALYSGSVVMAVFMLALLGSLSGFLVFNFNPAKVFMGDCGSLFLGFTIAASSAVCMTKAATLVGLALPALALGIPIFDTFFSMVRRFLERRSLFAPDQSHFHHRLLELGLHQRHAVIVIYTATFLAAGFGLFMLIRDDLGSLVIFGCVLLLLLLLFQVVGTVRLKAMFISLQQRRCESRREHTETKTFENLQLRFRQVHDPREWWQTVREAAQQFELAWVSVRLVNSEGIVETSVWRAQGAVGRSGRIVTMNLPLMVDGDRMQFELAVFVNGSLESATHRAALFSRLLDEGAAHDPAIALRNLASCQHPSPVTIEPTLPVAMPAFLAPVHGQR